jgi:hypothetical protein
MRFLFHPAADNEFDLAVEYYEKCQSGLGLEFAEEIYTTIARITEYPEVWSPDVGQHATMLDESVPVRDYLSNKRQQRSHNSYCQSTQTT